MSLPEDQIADGVEESRAVLASIVENANDAVIGKRLDGTIIVWNRAAARLFGYSADEMIGQNVRKLIPPDRQGEEDFIVQQARRGERIEHYHSQRLTKDGRALDLDLTVSPIRDSRGCVIGASTIARDITGMVQTESALRESEAKFRQLADSMPQIVWMTTAEGQIDYYNQRWYEYTGLPPMPESVDESYWRTVIHPDDAVNAYERWIESIRSGQPHLDETRIKEAATGQYHWHLVRGVPVRDETGKIVRWFGTCTDVEEIKRADERQKEQHSTLAHMERIRTMGQMASGLAHELNQPLGAILNYTVALQATLGKELDAKSQKLVRSIAEEVITQATRAGEIVRRMRAFVKKQRPEGQTKDMNELVSDSVNMLSYDLRQAHLHPVLKLEKNLPTVLVDGIQIQQVLVNLIRNAIDAMADTLPAHRRLRISTSAAEGFVWVHVTDGGCGILPENSSKIFDSFFTTKAHGLGMGLALCRTIIEDHGGHITAKPNDDWGSTFSFSVRAAPTPARAIAG
jgi:PAS domain S-box-containing protein